MLVNVGDVVHRKDLYPRFNPDPIAVQKYAEDLSVLPPIEINQNNELIDGRHRCLAHIKNKVDEIEAIVIKTDSDAHLLELAIEKNSIHGIQLTQEEKKDNARKIYNATPSKERDEKKKHLSKILSVSERTVRGWLSRIDKDETEKRNKKIFELWMQCYTQQEIAERVGCHKDTVSEICRKMATLPESDKLSRRLRSGFCVKEQLVRLF